MAFRQAHSSYGSRSVAKPEATSGMAPARDATTGVPNASPSETGRPHPSAKLGHKRTSARLYNRLRISSEHSSNQKIFPPSSGDPSAQELRMSHSAARPTITRSRSNLDHSIAPPKLKLKFRNSYAFLQIHGNRVAPSRNFLRQGSIGCDCG